MDEDIQFPLPLYIQYLVARQLLQSTLIGFPVIVRIFWWIVMRTQVHRWSMLCVKPFPQVYGNHPSKSVPAADRGRVTLLEEELEQP